MTATTLTEMRNILCNYLDDPSYVCVFPTETSARFWAVDYVLKGKKGALLTHQVMAWDSFFSEFIKKNDCTAVNAITRKLFALQFLRNQHNVHRLQWFRYPDYPQLSENLSSSIVTLLVCHSAIIELSVENLRSYRNLPSAYLSDIEFITSSYQKFLHDNSLYDMLFSLPEVSIPQQFVEKKLCIFFPELISQREQFHLIEKLITSLETFSYDHTPPSHTISVYPNELIELEEGLSHIQSLISSGVPPSEILITVGHLHRWKDPLIQSAKIRGIPLVYIEGEPLSNLIPGKFLTATQNLYAKEFPLLEMKKFLLHPQLPWRNRECNRSLILRAIELSITRGSHWIAKDSWEKTFSISHSDADKKFLELYKKIKIRIQSIATAKKIEDLKQHLYLFVSDFFDQTSDVDATQEDSFSMLFPFYIERLSILQDAMSHSSISSVEGLLDIYLHLLQQLKYVSSKQDVSGIPVCSYGFSVGLGYDHHLMLGCTDAILSSGRISLPLLSEPLWNGELRSGIDRDTILLNHYMLSSSHPRFSCAKQGFGSEISLVPAPFIAHNLVEDGKNSAVHLLRLEQEAWTNFQDNSYPLMPTQRQHLLANQLMVSHQGRFDIASGIDTLPVFDRLCDEKSLVTISSTALDTFFSCPMKWVCAHLCKIHKANYDPLVIDHAKIGSMMHDILAHFFSSITQEGLSYSSEADDLATYRTVLQQCVQQERERYERSVYAPSPTTRIYIEEAFLNSLYTIIACEAKVLPGGISIGFEKPITYEYPHYNYRLTGRIDRVVLLKEGEVRSLAIVDYKKTYRFTGASFDVQSQEIDSYQLPLYAKLLQDISEGKDDVSLGLYYDIRGGSYKKIWQDNEEKKLLIEFLEQKLLQFVLSLQKGMLGAQPSKKHCSFCDFRQICRRRYTVV